MQKEKREKATITKHRKKKKKDKEAGKRMVEMMQSGSS